MKILKYKKISSNKYEVILENNDKIKLYEDVILKEGLLLKKEIEDIELILSINSKYEIYEVALKYITNHLISVKGMKEYLRKKAYQEEDILKSINKLLANNFLNDEYFAKCYINDRINLSNDGPNKIIKYLKDNDIDEEVYLPLLTKYDNLYEEKIMKYLEKQKKANKKSAYYFKNKMLINLLNLGYDKEMINKCLNQVKITNQSELKQKEEAKWRKKYEGKYSNEQLERKIKEKLYQLGFFE